MALFVSQEAGQRDDSCLTMIVALSVLRAGPITSAFSTLESIERAP